MYLLSLMLSIQMMDVSAHVRHDTRCNHSTFDLRLPLKFVFVSRDLWLISSLAVGVAGLQLVARMAGKRKSGGGGGADAKAQKVGNIKRLASDVAEQYPHIKQMTEWFRVCIHQLGDVV